MSSKKIYQKIIFLVITFGIIAYVIIHNIIERAAVEKNPFETIATITSLEKCSKNGRCIYYKYKYGGKTYKARSRTDFIFSGWCKNKNNCVGFKFKIIINKDNPKQQIVEWDKIFEEKKFINYSGD
ncbi:hypothetical protein [Aquimarina macrocephali]|uniref:hypothetical protein n=1 Tax=Aquimarina macrocephali TaxID=666563 RepID=UPI003F6706B8